MPEPKTPLDVAADRALAAIPKVLLLSANDKQHKMASQIQKKLIGTASFGVVEELRGNWAHQKQTVVYYLSDLARSKAEALAEIIRSTGVSSASTKPPIDRNGTPGILIVAFGSDAGED